MSLSSMISLISRKGAAGSTTCISRRAAAGGCSSSISRRAAGGSINILGGCGVSTVVGDVSDESVNGCTNTSFPSSKLPWLLLPSETTIYKFYSLSEKKIVNFNEMKRGGELEDDAKLVGSSHGWLALLNNNNDLFLSNPLSPAGLHVKLPPIDTLPVPEHIPKGIPKRDVHKLIISCSPSDEEEDCRAMITYSPENRLAFCWPGHNTEWTPLIGSPFEIEGYMDFVYSNKQKLFFCITRSGHFEAWDLRDPRLPPTLIPMVVSVEEDNYPFSARSEKEFTEKLNSTSHKFLVIAEHSDELFLVRSSIRTRCHPRVTIGFDVYKYDPEERALKYMDSSLDGLALFIGSNHGFALCASEFPDELIKPNSIYFTDPDRKLISWKADQESYDCIFNYENRTFSFCYDTGNFWHSKTIVPPPIWFTPSEP